jgi:hypothetical protein
VTTDIPPGNPKRRFPTILQAFIITICGGAMAFFGCLGALSGLSGTGEIRTPAYVVLFIVGGLGFLFGIGLFLYFILKWVVGIVDARRGQGPTEPPRNPGA